MEVLRLRDLIIKNQVALQKWSMVVGYIVKSPADEHRIKSLLRKHDYEEAVLQSLRLWNEYGDKGADLLQVLRDGDLNSLSGTQAESE